MPIYKFHCDACGEEYEDFRNITEKEEKGECIKCASPQIIRVELIPVEECGCGCGCHEDPCGCR